MYLLTMHNLYEADILQFPGFHMPSTLRYQIPTLCWQTKWPEERK